MLSCHHSILRPCIVVKDEFTRLEIEKEEEHDEGEEAVKFLLWIRVFFYERSKRVRISSCNKCFVLF